LHDALKTNSLSDTKTVAQSRSNLLAPISHLSGTCFETEAFGDRYETIQTSSQPGPVSLRPRLGNRHSSQAQDFPKQPIKLVVPWAPGGNVDITARAVAPSMSEILGQQVIVENKPGAGGFIGSTGVVKSTPDGYTLLLGSSGSISIAPALTPTSPYNPVTDLVAIGPIHAVPIVLSASAKGSMKNFADFAARAKTDKNPISVGSAGNGSTQHLALELLALKWASSSITFPTRVAAPPWWT